MKKKFLVIYNPAAGKKNPALKLYLFKSLLDNSGHSYFIYHTSADGRDVDKLKNFVRSGFTDIIVVGGDGTLNMIINATADYPLPIGILPTGTGNDYIKNLTIGKSFKRQMETALDGQIIKVDVGKCNDKYFLNGIGLGYDGAVAQKLSTRKYFFTGHLAYLLIVLKSFLFFKEVETSFSIDGVSYREKLFMLTIGNGSTFGGGFKVTPGADIQDGSFKICLVRKISPIKRLWNLNRLRLGRHGRVKEITLLDGKNVIIQPSEAEAHMDGEPIGKPPFNISIHPKKILIKVAIQ